MFTSFVSIRKYIKVCGLRVGEGLLHSLLSLSRVLDIVPRGTRGLKVEASNISVCDVSLYAVPCLSIAAPIPSCFL